MKIRNAARALVALFAVLALSLVAPASIYAEVGSGAMGEERSESNGEKNNQATNANLNSESEGSANQSDEQSGSLNDGEQGSQFQEGDDSEKQDSEESSTETNEDVPSQNGGNTLPSNSNGNVPVNEAESTETNSASHPEDQDELESDDETQETPEGEDEEIQPGLVVDETGTRYMQEDGTYLTNSWIEIDGKLYYFADSGYTYLYGRWIDGRLYYFRKDGSAYTGWLTWADNGRRSYFGLEDGAALVGWQTIGGKRYYFDPETARTLYLSQRLDGELYYFRKDGSPYTGWVKWLDNGSRSYFSPSEGGVALSGWQTIGGKRYLFSDTNCRTYRLAKWVDDKLYYFDKNGATYTGWLTWADNNRRSYFSANKGGAALTGWQVIGGKRYYFDKDTCRTYYLSVRIDGELYYFTKKGDTYLGWVKWSSNGKRSYFAPARNGAAATGWGTIAAKRYYFNPDTTYAYSGKHVIDGNTYYFRPSNNSMVRGWYRWSDGRYSYFGGDGVWRFGSVRYTMPNGNDEKVTRTFNFGTSGKIRSNLVSLRMLSEASSRTSSSRYMLLVDTTNNWVGVCTANGNTWKLDHLWRCSTGMLGVHQTPSGTYQTGYRGYVFGHGYSCYYYTQIVNQVLFHSVKYYEGTRTYMDSRLGLHISNGCVRLNINKAKWIYDNIPRGTTVRVYRP